MTIEDHHLLCIGNLVTLYRQSKNPNDFTDLNTEDRNAIEECVKSAEQLGLPISYDRFIRGEPICTRRDN